MESKQERENKMETWETAFDTDELTDAETEALRRFWNCQNRGFLVESSNSTHCLRPRLAKALSDKGLVNLTTALRHQWAELTELGSDTTFNLFCDE